VRDLKRLLRVGGLHYFGLQAAERDGKSTRLSKESSRALKQAKLAVRRELERWPGIWVEDKGLTFSVHYRKARPPAVRAAHEALEKLLERWSSAFHVLNGMCVWEVLPKELPGKSAAIDAVQARFSRRSRSAIIHIGDDGTDEVAFAAMKDRATDRAPGQPPDLIGIRVAADRGTHAHYCLPSPAGVLRFLDRLERELR
jgi:trehalose 6-phosphate phosphatase